MNQNEQFADRVIKIVGPTLEKFGLALKRRSRDGLLIEYAKDTVGVTLAKDWKDQVVLVDIIELKNGRRLKYRTVGEYHQDFGGGIALGYILEARAPDVYDRIRSYYYPFKYPLSPEDEIEVLKIISDALETHCSDVLRGDFTIRRQLLGRMKENFFALLDEESRAQWEAIYQSDAPMPEDYDEWY